MAGVKIWAADDWFSKCVRERAEWKCEKCGTQYGPSSSGLQCSHFHGRANYAVRFDPLNAFAHCTACHYEMEGNPHEFTLWAQEQLGEGAYTLLLEKKNQLDNGRFARRDVKQKAKSEISRHYREQFRALQEKRELGEMGRLEFIGYF